MSVGLKTVIIGMGHMGKIRYDAMKSHGGFAVAAVCDHDAGRLQGYPEKRYTEWQECLEEEKPDAAVVCAVNAVIPEVVCAALEKGIHVFSEKPPGRTLKDALRMQAVHEERPDKVLKFGFNHRYHNSVIEAKSLIDSGLLGEVLCIRGVYGKAGMLYQTNEWRNDAKMSGGGILIDQGIHMLDLFRYFAGDFTEITGHVDNLVWKGSGLEDSVFATLRTPDHKVATIHSNSFQWKHKFDMDILCTDGYIALNGLLTSTVSYGEERITYYRKDLESRSGKLGNPKEYNICFDSDDSWSLEIEEFYDAVAHGRLVVNGTAHDAVEVMRMIDILYKEAEDRRKPYVI